MAPSSPTVIIRLQWPVGMAPVSQHYVDRPSVGTFAAKVPTSIVYGCKRHAVDDRWSSRRIALRLRCRRRRNLRQSGGKLATETGAFCAHTAVEVAWKI